MASSNFGVVPTQQRRIIGGRNAPGRRALRPPSRPTHSMEGQPHGGLTGLIRLAVIPLVIPSNATRPNRSALAGRPIRPEQQGHYSALLRGRSAAVLYLLPCQERPTTPKPSHFSQAAASEWSPTTARPAQLTVRSRWSGAGPGGHRTAA